MRLRTSVSLGALVTAIAATNAPAYAAAGDECIKVLGYEWSGEKQSMDPADMHSGDDAYHIFAVYNRLVDIDDKFNVMPELATEWSVSEDGKTWTFKLREGVKFHDGKRLRLRRRGLHLQAPARPGAGFRLDRRAPVHGSRTASPRRMRRRSPSPRRTRSPSFRC